jgi:thioredoxin-like negative regulator of GroEL
MKIIKFGAEWCPACKVLQPILESLIPANPSHEFLFQDIDTEEGSESAVKYNVKSLPTTIFLNHRNEEIYRFVGSKNKNVIQSYIDDLS